MSYEPRTPAIAIALLVIAACRGGAPSAQDGAAKDGGLAPVTTDAAPAPCDSPASCEARCVATPADADACVLAGDRLRTAAPPARDVEAALARHRATCESSRDPAACARAALMTALLDDRAHATRWIDPAAAPAAQLALACHAGERGRLACAALELLHVAVADPAGLRARLTCAEGAAPACAAAIAREVCERERLPEACYLVARAPGSGVDSPATRALATACAAERDPSVCHYAWLASGDVEQLARACPDDDDPRSIARACLDRASVLRARRRELSIRACRRGLCEGVADGRVLAEVCAAGQLDACARILLAPARKATPAQRADALARAAALAPDVALASSPPPPAKLRTAYAACRYGVASACAAVLAKLPPRSPLRAPLAGYAKRLRRPLAP